MAHRHKLLPVATVFHDEHWQSCLHDYLQHVYQQSQSESSYKTQRCVLQRFFADPGKTPDQYSRQDVEQFLPRPLDPNKHLTSVKPATGNYRRAVLNAFYEYAMDYTVTTDSGPQPLYIGKPPTRSVKRAKTVSSPRGMSEEEVFRFFAAIPTNTVAGLRDKALLLTYWWTGKRKREIAELRWKDIQPCPQALSGWQIAYIGKGKAGQVSYAELPGPAKEAIDRYLLAAGRTERICPDDYVFTQANRHVCRQGEEPLGDAWILEIMKKYLRLAGLDERHCIHTWRHTAAQMRKAAGLDIADIQRFLGHAHAYTTWRYLESVSVQADTGASILARRFGHL